MWLPVIRGLIERRILVNYRVDPDALTRMLPRLFRPQLVQGFGMAGICLIRLREVRPRGFPRWLGIGSENAAHRIAVEWDEDGEVRRGVYVLRRDTNSRLNELAGGRIFPGVHHGAEFRVCEQKGRYEIDVTSYDGGVAISVTGDMAETWPNGSVFGSLAEASAFFEAGSVGYSPTNDAGRYDGLELRCKSWRVWPLALERVRSSVFDDEKIFSRGSVEFDCALLMRGVEHEWHERAEMRGEVASCCGV